MNFTPELVDKLHSCGEIRGRFSRLTTSKQENDKNSEASASLF